MTVRETIRLLTAAELQETGRRWISSVILTTISSDINEALTSILTEFIENASRLWSLHFVFTGEQFTGDTMHYNWHI